MQQDFKSITRGGQTFLHTMRMISQIMRMVLVSGGIIFITTTALWFISHTTAYGRELYAKKLYAQLVYSINPHSTMYMSLENGERIKVYSHNFLTSPWTTSRNELVTKEIITSFKLGIGISLPFAIVMLYWFARRGKKIEETQLVKGSYVTTPGKMNALIKKTSMPGDLVLGDIRLPEKSELQHFLIHGTTGTGKSFLTRTLLYQIRARGDKAIVYDKHGTFVEKFYNPETDTILNPMDARCPPWGVWAECRDEADFESMSAALMPMPPSQSTDPFWVNAARTIFSCLTLAMKKQNIHLTKKLLHYLFSSDLSTLENLLKGTEAEILVSEKTEKTALSVKSVLATYIKPLKYLKDPKEGEEPFSIRKWVADDTQKGWLFISSRTDKHESLKPLISAWLDVAANALMSLPENPKRRLWMAIDELASLQRLPYLPATFAESRKFGGCLIVGLQNYFQLQKIYGPDGAKEIIDLCNIRAFFRAPSNEAAKWVSKEIGESELLETREGISYGANTVRDGVTLNNQTINRPTVTATEISNLPNLSGFISIPPVSTNGKYTKSWPIVHVNLTWENHPSCHPAYIELPESIVETLNESTVIDVSAVPSEASEDGFINQPQTPKKQKKKSSIVLDDSILF